MIGKLFEVYDEAIGLGEHDLACVLEVGERIESEKFRLGIILRSICPTKLKGIVAIRSQVAAAQRRVVAGSAHLSKKLTVFYSRE
jgi:hypothetical protein